MPDSITTSVLVGVASAVSKDFIGKAYDSGRKWLSAYFENHQAEAREAAERNASDFLAELAQKVDEVEASSAQSKATIDAAFKEPSFSVLLQKAILNGAQTSDSGKHQLLARLVAERLQSGEETTLSLASQLACDAIAHSTTRQLQVLGLSVALRMKMPPFDRQFETTITEEHFYGACDAYAKNYFSPLLVDQISKLDVLHLEALSCLKKMFVDHPIQLAVNEWSMGGFVYGQKRFFASEIGQKITPIWGARIRQLDLTSVGMLVGGYVADNLTGTTTPFGLEWTV